MKNIIIALLLFAAVIVNGQTKYFIYFKDKGEKLLKSSEAYKKALSDLTPRAIERRKKNMGENIITEADLPLYRPYLDELEKEGIKIVRKLKWFNAVSAFINKADIRAIESFPFVKEVSPVKSLKYEKKDIYPDEDKIFKSGSNNEYIHNYGPSLTQAELSDIPEVHNAGITGENVLIGLLDTGFNWEEAGIFQADNVLAEYDFINEDNVTKNEAGDPPTQHDHGTYVFSIIGAKEEGTLIGASFDSQFILAKTEVVGSETHLEEDNYVAALQWLEGYGVDITTSSLGYSDFDPGQDSYAYEDMDGNTTIVTKAAELAFERGVLTITSAGNEGNASWYYITAPADGFNTIAVGAVDYLNQLASYSSHGPTYDGRIKPDITTQGVSVYGASASGGYSYGGGTSAAAPIASGIAGLLLSHYPHLNNKQLRKIIQEAGLNADNPNNDRGYGLLSAKRAVNFPNLKGVDGNYRVHKSFVGVDKIAPESVTINFSVNSGEMENETMTFDGSCYYYDIPYANHGDTVQFTISYSDSTGSDFVVPSGDDYTFLFGDLNVSLVTSINRDLPDKNFYLYQNYPNPFNNQTVIEFYTATPEYSEVKVYDILGQSVKTLFKGISNEGMNRISWNGLSDSGGKVASGRYFYLLRVSGKIESKKMIMLK